ncbi:hypothetical protein ACIBF1_34355 [Spirillospora sp. NPDC050679]
MRAAKATALVAAVLAAAHAAPARAGARAPELTITATASQDTARPGDVVTFTVQAANTGTLDYSTSPDSVPAWFAADLTGVLDDADLDDGAAADRGEVRRIVLDGRTHLRWRGALPRGAKARLTFSVTLPPLSKGGDDTLLSSVQSDTPVNNCHVERPAPDDLDQATRRAAPCLTRVDVRP